MMEGGKSSSMPPVGSVWHGRGLKIRILQTGLGIFIAERLDISLRLRVRFGTHPWRVESLRGLTRVS
jgi:hypothetical protein